ncbi:MAG TPA: S41 family peptidase [Rhizomicrobium sp.]|nr:S41 family peptidase [Rhizomicrobium sp.]
MKFSAALFAATLLSNSALALTPTERFDQASKQAQALFDARDYARAAAALKTIADDPTFAAQQDYPDRFYALARASAALGKGDEAIAALTKAVDLGATPTSEEVTNEKEFASLKDDARFKQQVARIVKAEALWKDDPALATPYKPVLSEAEKVAGLSKLWAEARFDFAFFGRIPEVDWDATYMAYLPQVIAAKTTEDYYRVLMRFMATLKDGHTRVLAPPELQDRFNGVTKVTTRLIEGKVLVTGVSDRALEVQGVKTGAEIVQIDGRPALEYAKAEVEPYVFGFTPQDRNVWTYDYALLRGPVDQPVRLTLREAGGKTVTATVPRQHNNGPFGILPEIDLAPHFRMLPGNIAYLQVNVFVDDNGAKAMRENFAAISRADGLIIDVRENSGGNDDNAHLILQMLADKPYMGNNWRTRDYRAAFRSWSRPIGWMRRAGGEHQPDPKYHFGGPVIVLTSARTFSAAEDFTSGFDAMKRGRIVGETTGGSTGNPYLFALPGGGRAFVCTKDDTYWNGQVFEGVGIKPDVAVSPTIADIRAGRDRVLEKAVNLLRTGH